jgi:hypothetical protein
MTASVATHSHRALILKRQIAQLPMQYHSQAILYRIVLHSGSRDSIQQTAAWNCNALVSQYSLVVLCDLP